MAKILTQDKRSLRTQLLQERKSISAENRQQWDQRIAENVVTWCRLHRPVLLGVFWPIQAEPDLHAAYCTLSQEGVALALPVVVAKHQPLAFYRWQPDDATDLDSYGIPIPARRDQVVTPDALLIPCVGYNSARFRLGYGGGFYDRTLAQLPETFSVGIAYQTGLCEFAAGEHDLALNVIVTE